MPTQSEAIGSRMPELAEIAFVTRRFGDLQRLRFVALGAGLVVTAVASELLPPDARIPLLHIGLPAQLMFIALRPCLDRYYQSLGRTESGKSERTLVASMWSSNGVGAGAFFVLMGLIADWFRFIVLEQAGGASLAATAAVAYSAAILVRDRLRRPHYFAGFIGAAIAVAISSSIPWVSLSKSLRVERAIGATYGRVYAVLGLTLMMIGLFDHRLLLRAMSRRDTGFDRPRNDVRLAGLRVIASAACLGAMLMYVVAAGWPKFPVGILMAIYFGICVFMFLDYAFSLRSACADLVAYSELTRRREARLLAELQATRVAASVSTFAVDADFQAMPPPDLVGHVVFPLAIASGAVVDLMLPRSAMPSLLAVSLAASQLWIAGRDWPDRRHYLLGAIAASISAIQFIFTGRDRHIDWAVSFVILMSASMLVEGLLDTRLDRLRRTDGTRHADAL